MTHSPSPAASLNAPRALPQPAHPAATALIQVSNLSLWYGTRQALDQLGMSIHERRVTAFIGPSGCGKSTLLRCFNRLNELLADVRRTGTIRIASQDIFRREVDVLELRKRIALVFQKANPLPKSIYDNIAFALRLQGVRDRSDLDSLVEQSLRDAVLWDEVKDRLHHNALTLSGGQQQRLCIARAIAIRPEILLLDEPASALDPIATGRIEDLMLELKKEFTLLVATHNMQQAARISDYTAFLYLGALVEYDTTAKIFTAPAQKQTEDFITGRFG